MPTGLRSNILKAVRAILEKEVPKLTEFAQSLGVDMISLRSLHPHDTEGLLKGSANSGGYRPENPRYQRFKTGPDGITLMRRDINPCRKLWNSTTVHWNGTVCPCCFDPHDRYSLGNLSVSGFREIWRGPLYREMRREFRRDYRSIKVCSDCTYAFEGGGLSTEDFIETHFFDDAQR